MVRHHAEQADIVCISYEELATGRCDLQRIEEVGFYELGNLRKSPLIVPHIPRWFVELGGT